MEKEIKKIPSLPMKENLLETCKFKTTFKENGIVVIKGVISSDMVKQCKADIWETVLDYPYKPEIKEQLDLKDIETLRKYYPMTGGFGALTIPPAFHTKGQWMVRQDPSVVGVFSTLLNTNDISVHFDRISFKLPGQGEREFCHWDSDPWSWPEEEYESLQGILTLTPTSFFAVPKTNTNVFRKKFIKVYPKSKRKDQYFIQKNNDPFNLLKKVKEYKLNPGDLVIWSNRLLHEARKNTTNSIRMAHYISFFPKGKYPKGMKRFYDSKKQSI